MQQYQWVCFYIILKKEGTRTQTTNHDSILGAVPWPAAQAALSK
jgi:hypothetical protein